MEKVSIALFSIMLKLEIHKTNKSGQSATDDSRLDCLLIAARGFIPMIMNLKRNSVISKQVDEEGGDDGDDDDGDEDNDDNDGDKKCHFSIKRASIKDDLEGSSVTRCDELKVAKVLQKSPQSCRMC